ncbi:hypothetical protein D3C76_906820 [compost metagenome]
MRLQSTNMRRVDGSTSNWRMPPLGALCWRPLTACCPRCARAASQDGDSGTHGRNARQISAAPMAVKNSARQP